MAYARPEQISAFNLSHFTMGIIMRDEIDEIIGEQMKSLDPAKVVVDFEAEKKKVEEASTAQELADLLRKIRDMRAKARLVKRILEVQEEAMPYVMSRFYTSAQDFFIESASLVLAHCEEKYIDEMFENYDKIACFYAQAHFCTVLGFRGRKDKKSFLIKEYERLRKVEDKMDYSQGPLVGLNDL